jgi:hypothetical protein
MYDHNMFIVQATDCYNSGIDVLIKNLFEIETTYLLSWVKEHPKMANLWPSSEYLRGPPATEQYSSKPLHQRPFQTLTSSLVPFAKVTCNAPELTWSSLHAKPFLKAPL